MRTIYHVQQATRRWAGLGESVSKRQSFKPEVGFPMIFLQTRMRGNLHYAKWFWFICIISECVSVSVATAYVSAKCGSTPSMSREMMGRYRFGRSSQMQRSANMSSLYSSRPQSFRDEMSEYEDMQRDPSHSLTSEYQTAFSHCQQQSHPGTPRLSKHCAIHG